MLLFAFADPLLKSLVLKNEHKRKLVHAGLALAVFVLPYFFRPVEIITLLVIFLVFLGLYSWAGPHTHRVNRFTLGEFYFPVGIIVSTGFFLPQNLAAFQFGVLILGLADAAADVIGSHYGQHQIKFLKDKTWEGTTAFFLTALIITAGFAWHQTTGNVYDLVLVCLILSITESLLSFGLDNLVLPVLGAWLFKLFI